MDPLFVIAASVGGALFLRWGLGRPSFKTNSPEAVLRLINALLLRGVDGAWLHFQLKRDPSKVVAFTKYVRSFGDIGFRGTLSNNAVDRATLSRFRSELQARNIQSVGVDEVAIDFGRDVGLAHVFVRLAFDVAFGASLERDGTAYQHAVLVINMPNKTGSN